jgi:hypothetical protein
MNIRAPARSEVIASGRKASAQAGAARIVRVGRDDVQHRCGAERGRDLCEQRGHGRAARRGHVHDDIVRGEQDRSVHGTVSDALVG